MAREPASETRRREGFWDRNQPGIRLSSSAPGSRGFFAEAEAYRYSLEPHVREVVGFPRWAGLDVLEAGCGIGTDGLQFARAGARYTGLDRSAAAIRLARQRFAMEEQPGTFAEGSVTSLPFEDRAFDLVFSHGVIHHIEDTEAAVSEFHRVLRPGGTALVMVYHRNSLNYRFGIMLLRRAMIPLLLVPGAVGAVSKITGESKDVLAAHRELLRGEGPSYIRDRQLFLSNNTDGPGNPLSKVYSRAEGTRLLRDFEHVHTDVRYLNLRIYPLGTRLARTRLATRLERRFGWHLYVSGRKPEV